METIETFKLNARRFYIFTLQWGKYSPFDTGV